MAESYEGIPRKEIPWFPTIDRAKCNGCGTCVAFCHQGVYVQEGETVVANPYSCVVGCTGCRSHCPEQAISFPTLRNLADALHTLRRKYPRPPSQGLHGTA